MHFDSFEMYLYDEDEDPNHEKSLLQTGTRLEKFIIRYELSEFPTVELILVSPLYDTFSRIKNAAIHITVGDSIVDYNFCIIHAVDKEQNTIHMEGYLCKYEDYIAINSSYLGDSFIGCMRNLNIKNKIKINGKDGYAEDFSNDFSFSYWKIQESNIQAANKILRMAYDGSVYTMDNDNIYINTIDYNNTNYNYEMEAPNELLFIDRSFRINDMLNEKNDEKLGNCIYEYKDEMAGLSNYTSMGRFFIGNFDDPSLNNYTKSLPRIVYQGDVLIKCLYKNKYFPMIIGNSMKKMDTIITTTSNWYVVSKIERWSATDGIQTAITFSAKQ